MNDTYPYLAKFVHSDRIMSDFVASPSLSTARFARLKRYQISSLCPTPGEFFDKCCKCLFMILFTLYASALFGNGFIHVDAIDTQRAFIGELIKIHRCEI